MIANTRHANRTLLRVFAVLLLAYGNGLVLLRWPDTSIWGTSPSALGLALVFTIAGYGAATLWETDPHAGRFLMRCGARLMPGLIVYVVLTAVVMGPIMTRLPLRRYFLRPETVHYLQNILLRQQTNLPGVFEGRTLAGAVNPLLWSLLVGLIGCLAILVVGRLPKPGRASILIMAAACSGLAGLWGASSGLRILVYHADPVAILSLLVFFLAAVAIRTGTASSHVAIGSDAAILAFVSNGLAAAWLGWISVPLLWLTLPIMVTAIEMQPTRRRSIADPSLGVFLYGFPIQQTILAEWPANQWPIPTCLGLSLAAGLVSWFLVEQPARTRVERALAR